MPEPITRGVLRRIVTLPDGLPDVITGLHAEVTALLAKHNPALAALNELAEERHDEAARASDSQRAATAVRAGRPASTAGTPATDALAKERKAALGEVDALEAGAGQGDAEMGAEFGKLIADPKTSGLPEVEAARVKYARSIETMLAAREAACAALTRAAFLRLAAPSETWPEGPDGRVIPVPEAVEAAMGRMAGRQLSWNPTPPNVAVNSISTSGERDYQIPPVTAAHLIAQTLGAEFPTTPKEK